MHDLPLFRGTLIGLGATLTLDLWALFLHRAFQIVPSSFCLLGRWLRYLSDISSRSISSAAICFRNDTI